MAVRSWLVVLFHLPLVAFANKARKHEQLTAAEVVANGRQVLTSIRSAGHHLRFIVCGSESPTAISSTGSGPGPSSLVLAVEAALAGETAPSLRGLNTLEGNPVYSSTNFTYYGNINVVVIDVDSSVPDSSIESAIVSLQKSEAVSVVEPDSLLYQHTANVTSPVPPGHKDINDRIKIDTSTAVKYNYGKNKLNNLGSSDVVPDLVNPNDPFLYLQWGLADIGAEEAWRDADLSAEFYKPKVVVVDSGIDYRHEDIAMNAFINLEELYGDDTLDDDGNGFKNDVFGWNTIPFTDHEAGYPLDDQGHGTHCAGIIGAVTNNGNGVAGVHYGPSLVPCKFLSKDGYGYLSDAIVCVDYAIAIGADVMSNSYGSDIYSFSLESTFQRASDAGIVIVASAGNEGRSLEFEDFKKYPCAFDVDALVCVAATTVYDELAYWSNYGVSTVALAAPGLDIASTYIDQQYYFMSGTSMAAPFVAGAAAFLRSVNGNLSNVQILDILYRSAKPFVDWETKVKYGKLDLAAAVELAVPPEYQTTSTTSTRTVDGTSSATGTVNGTATGTGAATGTATGTGTATRTMTPLPVYVILANPLNTCDEECARYGGVCNEEEMVEVHTDLQYCFDALVSDPPHSLPRNFTLGSVISSWTYPYGCVVNGGFSVQLNTIDYGVEERGCRAAASPSPSVSVSRVCSCVDP
eukprot:Lankesteria_metandrocarpae@DN5256_c1_g3_i2.p1